MAEYIVRIDESEKNYDEHFVGVLRLYPELIRCKDCRWFSQTTLGMTYACWHGAETVWGQTGEHAGHNCCQRIESEDHYCGYGERKPNENTEENNRR